MREKREKALLTIDRRASMKKKTSSTTTQTIRPTLLVIPGSFQPWRDA